MINGSSCAKLALFLGRESIEPMGLLLSLAEPMAYDAIMPPLWRHHTTIHGSGAVPIFIGWRHVLLRGHQSLQACLQIGRAHV